jgi:hypothetical protein
LADATTLAVNYRAIWRIPQHQPFANRLAAHMLASMALFFRKKSLMQKLESELAALRARAERWCGAEPDSQHAL